MPRDGSGVYTKPFPNVLPDTTVESTVYNGFVADVETDLNAARPIIAGGTGATDATTARANIKAEVATAIVTNYDSQIWEPGSFYSAATATSPPGGIAHRFAGICYGPDQNNLVLEARDLDDAATPGTVYVREKTAGVWAPVWTPGGSFVSKTGDTMSGDLKIQKADPYLMMDALTAGSPVIWAGKSGVARWLMSLASGAESTGNAGSNLTFSRYSDAGTLIDMPLTINRNNAQLSLTGDVNIIKSSPTLVLNDTDLTGGSSADIWAQRAGSARWIMRFIGGAETGSNNGSDFTLFAISDTGSILSNPITIKRSDGHVNFAGYVQIDRNTAQLFLNKQASGGTSQIYGMMANQTRWLMEMGSSDAESGTATGSSFALHRYNNASGYLGQVWGVDRATGRHKFNGPVEIDGGASSTGWTTGDLQVQGGIGAFGNCWFSQGFTCDTIQMGTTAGLNYQWARNGGTGFLRVYGAQGSFSGYEFAVQSTSGQITAFQIDNSGHLKANYTAGTLSSDASGNIFVSSDERLKDVRGPFTRGLDALRKIGGADIFSWKHEAETHPDQRYAGFIAQKVQRGIPEAVNVDPHDGTLALDDRPLIATLMNAVIELADRVEQLTKGTK